jgi:hypothetical protein
VVVVKVVVVVVVTPEKLSNTEQKLSTKNTINKWQITINFSIYVVGCENVRNE